MDGGTSVNTTGAPRLSGKMSFYRLLLLTYSAGYVLYVIPALVWGWNSGEADPFFGFALWQLLLYGPLWPIVLFIQLYRFLIPVL